MADQSSSQMGAFPTATTTTTQRDYYCMDDASIRGLVEVLAQERAHILQALGSTYKASLHSVGFCQEKPVQIVSPFDLQPGKLRRSFLETFAALEATGDLKKMPYLIYWFEDSLRYESPHITLEPSASVLSFELGERLSYDRIPKDIEKKIRTKQALTAHEKLVCDALDAFDAARESGSPPVNMQPDEEVYKVMRAPNSTSQVQAESVANNASSEQAHLPKQKNMPKVGERIKVKWDFGLFYYGMVTGVRDQFYFIEYDDEETQWLPLADFTFEIVPESERSKEALPKRAPDARWSMDTPGKCLPKQAESSPQEVDESVRDGDDESERQGTKTKDGTATPTRTLRNGFWIPKSQPKKDDKGFFIRPMGRPPKGFEWDRRKGWFAPSGMLSKRPNLHTKRKVGVSKAMSETVQKKKARTGHACSEFVEQSAVTITKKEEDVNSSVQTRIPEAGQASAEGEDPLGSSHADIRVKRDEASVATSGYDNSSRNTKLSEVETSTAELVGMLPLSDDASVSETKQVHRLLVKLYEEDELLLTRRICNTLQKPVKSLCSHTALGGVAKPLLLKLTTSYSGILVGSLRKALAGNETQQLQKKVIKFYKRITAGDIALDEAFILKHSLIDLLAEISIYLNDKGIVVMKELAAIQSIVNENVELEDSTDV